MSERGEFVHWPWWKVRTCLVMTGGGRCYPLAVLDDHSRDSLVLAACGNQRRETVQGHLTTAFRRYGLPEAMLMENGPPWGAPQVLEGSDASDGMA